jgi:hypothetical protein
MLVNVKYKLFRTSYKKWEELFEEAAGFASTLGDRLINITQSCDHSDSLVTVWYWDK